MFRSANKRVVVYEGRDEDGVIEVIDEERTVRSLQFGTEARQSTMFLKDPDALALVYTHCLMTSLLFANPSPKAILVLGLGGGSVPKFILRQFPGCRVDAVEKRSSIVDVARDYFSLPADDSRLQVHLQDGLQFLSKSKPHQYDLIVVDLHDSAGMSPVVQRAEFFPACVRGLRPQGVVATNMWYGYRERGEREVRRLMHATFDNRLLFLPVAGKRNCVVLAFDQPPTADPAQVRERAREWQRRTQIDFPDLVHQLARANKHSGLVSA